jgi:hypothetical protein
VRTAAQRCRVDAAKALEKQRKNSRFREFFTGERFARGGHARTASVARDDVARI